MPRVTMPDGAVVDMPDNPSPEQLAELQKVIDGPVQTGADFRGEVGKVLDKGIRGGLASLPGLALDMTAKIQRDPIDVKAPLAFALPLKLMKSVLPQGMKDNIDKGQFGDETKDVQTLGGLLPPLSQPETTGGKYAGAGLEGIVSALTGGGAGTAAGKAATGAGAGLGGEASANLLGDNVLTRLLGGLLGGGAASISRAVKPNAESIVRQSTEHMTPADWARANRTADTMKGEGIPFLNSQVLGPRSTLADAVETGSANPAARSKIVSNVESVPTKFKSALDRLLLRDLPINTAERPGVLNDVQSAAEASIKAKVKKSNDAFEAAMPPTSLEYQPARIQELRDRLVGLAQSPKFGVTSDGGKAIMKYADDLVVPGGDGYITNAHQVNNLIKDINAKAGALTGDYRGLPVMDVKRLMKQYTPEFDPARAAKQGVMTAEVAPMKKSLTGQIAEQGGGVRPDKVTARDSTINLVFPPGKAQPQAIAQMGKDMGGDAVGQVLREHLAQSIEKATKLSSATGGLQQPFDFVQSIAGTEAQRKNVEAALRVSAQSSGAKPEAVINGFYKLLKAMESTKDLKVAGSTDKAAQGMAAGQSLPGLIVAPASRGSRFIWEKVTASTYKRLADMMLDQNGLKQLETIARSPKPELVRQAAVSLLTAAQSGKDNPAE